MLLKAECSVCAEHGNGVDTEGQRELSIALAFARPLLLARQRREHLPLCAAAHRPQQPLH